MALKYRRLIFAFFTLLFCFLVPVVLLYATGHTINWRRFSLEKTATILIDSEPSGAAIFLNGKPATSSLLDIFTPQAALTQARIKDLAPGEYVIRLENYGYWPWEERIRLAPGEALNLGTVRLFSQNKPELIKAGIVDQSVASPQGSYLALLDKTTLTIINTDKGQIESIALPETLEADNLLWAPDESTLLIGSTLINLRDKSLQTIKDQQGAPLSLIHWDRLDSSLLYGLSGNKLFKHNLINGQNSSYEIAEIKSGELISDFQIYRDQTYLVILRPDGSEKLLAGTLGRSLEELDLPPGQYHFILENPDRPVLRNTHSNYVIDKPLPLFSKPRLLEISGRVATGRWLGNSIIYATPLELRRWDSENSDYILNRFGSPVTGLWPIDNGQTIVVSLNDDIRVYTQGRASFTISLAPIKGSSGLTVSKNQKAVYIYGSYQDQIGVFRLTL